MSYAWSVFAYAGWLALAASAVPRRFRCGARWVPVLALALGVPFAWGVRGVIGDPAYVTGLFVWAVAWSRLAGRPFPGGAMAVGSAACVFAVESALVVSAVSAAPADCYYGPGFDRPVLCALVALGAALFGVRAPTAFALAVPAAALLALTGAHDSRNAWDWYFDPMLAVWAGALLAVRAFAAVRREHFARHAANAS